VPCEKIFFGPMPPPSSKKGIKVHRGKNKAVQRTRGQSENIAVKRSP